MPDDLYADSETSSVAAAPADNDAKRGDNDLVSRDFFPANVEVGDTFTIKVVHLYPDEVEISREEETSEEETPKQSPEEQLEALAVPPP